MHGLARVFVRPHEVTIDTKTDGLPAIAARVRRIHSAGPFVRVELQTAAGQTLVAELSQERFVTMSLESGAEVYVRPRHIRVFSELESSVSDADPARLNGARPS